MFGEQSLIFFHIFHIPTPTMLLVVTKIDLLPTSLSPSHLEHWFRQRARECGASGIKKVHFVSKVKNLGIKSLVDDVVELVGARGNVWVVGMKDSGKKVLFKSMRKCVGVTKGEVRYWTEASVPGSIRGIVRIEGVLPGQAKLLDTPRLLNPHQITPRLTCEEQELVRISKKMNPRTYRIEEGHSVHIGGLMRLDIEELSVDAMYVTVWASPLLLLHIGKTENADNVQLQPPFEGLRYFEEKLGKWARHEFRVSGNSWESSSVDIAAGGIGWFAIGFKGEASVGVWTYEGIDVVLRDSLIPDRSKKLEVAGFSVSETVSKADQALNEAHPKGKKKKKQNEENVVALTE